MAQTIQRVFKRVLDELADLDNPMRTPLGHLPGEGAFLDVPAPPSTSSAGGDEAALAATAVDDDPLRDLPEPLADEPPTPARPDRARSRSLPRVERDPAPGSGRSRYDPSADLVYYNDRHGDYLLVKDDEATLLDYLATLVAKEYVVYNNARAPADELAEEMVRVVIRVRRHLPRRR